MHTVLTQRANKGRARHNLGAIALAFTVALVAIGLTATPSQAQTVSRPAATNTAPPQFAVPAEVSQRFTRDIEKQQRARLFPIDLQWGITQ